MKILGLKKAALFLTFITVLATLFVWTLNAGAFTTYGGWKFAVCGDTRSGHDNHDENIQAIINKMPNNERITVWNVGDATQDGRNSQWQTWQNIIAPLDIDWGNTTPPEYMSPVGNHDTHESGWQDRWAHYLPSQVGLSAYSEISAHSKGLYGSVKYENVIWIWVDTDSLPSGQETFLENTLSRASQDPEVVWRFVLFHHPPVVCGGDHPDWKPGYNWHDDYFKPYDVDIVFNGHNHHYERICPIISASQKICDENNRGNVIGDSEGVVYITSGGGGASPDVIGNCSFMEEGKSSHHYLEVEVNGNSLNIKAWDTDNGGSVNPTLIDDFTIVKSYQCSDGIDNDRDGFIDYPNDTSCLSSLDNNENDDTKSYECNDNIDNDGDGLTDYPQDPGCLSVTDDDEYNESQLYQCNDGIDNDGDNFIDYPDDPDCKLPSDNNEYDADLLYYEAEDMNLISPMMTGSDSRASQGKYISPTTGTKSKSPVPEATLGIIVAETSTYYLWIRMMGPESGSDALYVGVDYTWDRVFPRSVNNYEWVRVETAHNSGNYGFYLIEGTHTIQIGHGEINAQADVLFVTNDPEETPVDLKKHQCSDNYDNDGDGLTDYPQDQGCLSDTDDDEYNESQLYQCNDGIDNDGDNFIDYPDDQDCLSPTGETEYNADLLYYEAEDMNLISPMVTGSDSRASQGKYISPTKGTKSKSPAPEATLGITVPATNTYYLWIRMMGPDSGSDALYVGIDYTWDRVFPRLVNNYEWVRVETAHNSGNYGFYLTEGTHSIQIGHGEINAKADVLFLTSDPEEKPVDLKKHQCSDNHDNDGDGLTDYPQDPGCLSDTDDDEYNASQLYQCSDGMDNDGDSFIDFPDDPDCKLPSDNNEYSADLLYYEAEDMNLISPMVRGNDSRASQGKYICPIMGTESKSPIPEATLGITVPATNTYYLWIRMMGPDSGNDALYVGIDYTWDRVFPRSVNNYEWVRVETAHNSGNYGFYLTEGTHTIQIGHGEINAQADVLFLTSDPKETPN